MPFSVRMGGVGLYTVAAEARADGVALGKDVFQTDVEGLADVNFVVTEKRRVVDVDGETVYTIQIDNAGTKEATQLLVSAVLSENIEPVKTSGPDERQAQYNPAKHEVVFPAIDGSCRARRSSWGSRSGPPSRASPPAASTSSPRR